MKQYPLFKVHIDIEAAMGEIKKVMESGYINEGVQVTQLENVLHRGRARSRCRCKIVGSVASYR